MNSELAGLSVGLGAVQGACLGVRSWWGSEARGQRDRGLTTLLSLHRLRHLLVLELVGVDFLSL